MPEKNSVRVTIRVPTDIHLFIKESCSRVISVRGKELQLTKSLNDAYNEVLKRGVLSYEGDENSV